MEKPELDDQFVIVNTYSIVYHPRPVDAVEKRASRMRIDRNPD
jgi:hypothetical protein